MARKRSYFKNNEAFYVINENITTELADDMQDFLIGLENDTRKISKVNFIINTNGGDVYAGDTMYNSIKQCSYHTVSKVMGNAYSYGANLALATNEIQFFPMSRMMIHKAWSDDPNAKEVVDKINEGLVTMLKPYFGDKTEKYLEKDSYFTANELLDLKIIKKVEDVQMSTTAHYIYNMYIKKELIQMQENEEKVNDSKENEEFEIVSETEIKEVIETKEEVKKTETIEEIKEEIKVQIVNPDDFKKMQEELQKLMNELNANKKTIDELTSENFNLKTVKETEEKEELLVQAGVTNKDIWMKHSVADIKLMISSIPVKKNIKMEFVQSSNKNIKDMTPNEWAEIRKNDPELYKKLMLA